MCNAGAITWDTSMPLNITATVARNSRESTARLMRDRVRSLPSTRAVVLVTQLQLIYTNA